MECVGEEIVRDWVMCFNRHRTRLLCGLDFATIAVVDCSVDCLIMQRKCLCKINGKLKLKNIFVQKGNGTFTGKGFEGVGFRDGGEI